MKRIENRIGNLFKKKWANSTATAANEVQVVSTCVKPPFVIPEDVLDAEIIWCLHLVHYYQSYQSCNPLPTVFQRMFKTCSVAQQFYMKKDKATYMIVYDLNKCITIIQCLFWWKFEPSSTKMPNGCELLGWWKKCCLFNLLWFTISSKAKRSQSKRRNLQWNQKFGYVKIPWPRHEWTHHKLECTWLDKWPPSCQ